MKKFFVIIAKSSCGKDTLYYSLKDNKEFNFHTFVLYYTRPMRTGEINGETYRFVSNKEMSDLKITKSIIANEYYPTAYGGCEIAMIDDDQIEKDGNYLCVMSLKFYEKLKEYFENDNNVSIIPIYIEVPAKDRLSRSLLREEENENPNYKEIIRRFIADENDFPEDVVSSIPKTNVFINDNYNDFLNEVISFIHFNSVS